MGNAMAHACPAWWTQLELDKVTWVLLVLRDGTNFMVRIHGGKVQEEKVTKMSLV